MNGVTWEHKDEVTTVTRLIKRRFRKPVKCVYLFIVDKESNHVVAFLHDHDGELVH